MLFSTQSNIRFLADANRQSRLGTDYSNFQKYNFSKTAIERRILHVIWRLISAGAKFYLNTNRETDFDDEEQIHGRAADQPEIAGRAAIVVGRDPAFFTYVENNLPNPSPNPRGERHAE